MQYIIYITFNILIITAITAFSIKRHLNYLHIFQQQEYDNKRFLTWILSKFAFDKKFSAILLLYWGINNFLPNIVKTSGIILELKFAIISLTLAIFAIIEKNPLNNAKKKLVLTKRATRIYYTALCLNFFINLYLLSKLNLNNSFIILLLFIHLIPAYLILSNILLTPIENYIQKKILRIAKQKLTKLDPIVIGITGSFGKTSVKHFLGHILQQIDHTLITAGSINTTMGISRAIKEELNPNHKYFVVEMGAYGIGSIAKICELTSPDFGIITAIGAAHYERFKDLETVANAKFELADSVIKKHNSRLKDKIFKMLISEQVINTNYAKIYTQKNKEYLKILDSENINNIQQLKSGLTWDLNIDGINYKIQTPIFGIHNVINLSLAIITAYNLQIPMPNILAALKSMPQIHHRLEVIRNSNFTIIDDSYNANPEGFRSALMLLSLLHEPPGRKILITPGLVELGTKHTEEHFHLGEFAANHVDLAIIVNPKRIKSFIAGFQQNAGANKQLINVASFNEAKHWMDNNCQSNDVVLIANDLPDIYETGLNI